MAINQELLVSARDAEVLSVLVGERRRMDTYDARAADSLVDALLGAKTVPHDLLPGDRVALHSRVAYSEEPGGTRRVVTIVHPEQANVSEGRISVLSPVGQALLGRRRGSATTIRVPGARALQLKVLEVEKDAGEEA